MIITCRNHPSIQEAGVVSSDHDPLTSVASSSKTGVHLALEDGRHERALIILKHSNCQYYYNRGT